MHRLFVALRPPPLIRQRLLGLMGGVANARWQEDDQLHLTLRFIGEVDRHLGADIAAALGGIRHNPVDLSLSGVGTFGRAGRGTIWAGVAPHDELKSLHKKVDQACRRAGVPPDGRALFPHITVARLGRGAGPSEPFLARWAGLSSDPFQLAALLLYESRLGASGASYTVVERYPLCG